MGGVSLTKRLGRDRGRRGRPRTGRVRTPVARRDGPRQRDRDGRRRRGFDHRVAPGRGQPGPRGVPPRRHRRRPRRQHRYDRADRRRVGLSGGPDWRVRGVARRETRVSSGDGTRLSTERETPSRGDLNPMPDRPAICRGSNPRSVAHEIQVLRGDGTPRSVSVERRARGGLASAASETSRGNERSEWTRGD
jgi:hypothetical protein